MDKMETLIELLVQKFKLKGHIDPKKSAYVYIASMASRYIPDETIDFHIDYNEKDIVMLSLKA